MTERKLTCKSCHFFGYLPGEEEGKGALGGMGECRRRAPVAYSPPIGKSINDCSKSVVWPQLLDSEWCGEYERQQESW
ncbi:MAG: hypothetical protein WBP44_04175 [Gammaproteobacteria bacterium]